MFCRRCGAQIPDDSTFCARCGTPIAFTDSPGNQPTMSEQFVPSPPGEQFTMPPPWQGPPPPSGGMFPGGPGPYGLPPPRPLVWERLFGPRLQPGATLTPRNRVQRRFFSRLAPRIASSVWFGAIAGAVFAFVLALVLSLAFSLTLGSTLDQSSFGPLASGASLGASQLGLSTSNPLSFYSNPFLLLAYAHRSAIDLTLNATISGLSLSGGSLNFSGSVTPPVTLLLILPAISLLFGGYLAVNQLWRAAPLQRHAGRLCLRNLRALAFHHQFLYLNQHDDYQQQQR